MAFGDFFADLVTDKGKLKPSVRHDLTDAAHVRDGGNLYAADYVFDRISKLRSNDPQINTHEAVEQKRAILDQAITVFSGELLKVQRHDAAAHTDKKKLVAAEGVASDEVLSGLLDKNRGIALAKGPGAQDGAALLREKMPMLKEHKVVAIGVDLPKDYQASMDRVAEIKDPAQRMATFNRFMEQEVGRRDTMLKRMEASGDPVQVKLAETQRRTDFKGAFTEAQVTMESGLQVVCVGSPVNRQQRQDYAASRGNTKPSITETNTDFVDNLHTAQGKLPGYGKIVVVADAKHFDTTRDGYVSRSMDFPSVSVTSANSGPGGKTITEKSGIDYTLSRDNGTETMRQGAERKVEVRKATAVVHEKPEAAKKDGHDYKGTPPASIPKNHRHDDHTRRH